MGLALIALGSTGCASATPAEAASAEQQQNEEKASRLLERARETKSAERYRQLVLRFPDTHAAGEARDELAEILIKEAKASLAEQDWSTAEDRAEEARMYAGLELTRAARAVQQQIDDQRAEQVAKEATQLARDGKCASALKAVAVPVRQKVRERFKAEARKRAREALVGCLSRKLEEEIAGGNVDAARTMLASPDATAALDKPGYDQAEQALRKAIVKQSTSAIQPLLASQKWAEALAKLDELKQQGTLGKAEYPLAFELVQDAIKAHLLKLAESGLTAKKPADVARDFDQQLALAKYKLVPKDLSAARAKLAIAVECEEQRCKLGSSGPVWAWGTIALHPPADASGAQIGSVKHAQKVWVIGKAKEHVLIATEDPAGASGSALLSKASGWADPENLENTDTRLWLPPADQLAGVQVWAPLRPPSKDYLLGKVKKVEGKNAVVERMADGRDQTVDLKSLRIGSLDQGLQVMAFCADPLKPEKAKVDSVVTTSGGTPKVKVVCDKGGLQKVEVAGALTSKVDWLPPRKP